MLGVGGFILYTLPAWNLGALGFAIIFLAYGYVFFALLMALLIGHYLVDQYKNKR